MGAAEHVFFARPLSHGDDVLGPVRYLLAVVNNLSPFLWLRTELFFDCDLELPGGLAYYPVHIYHAIAFFPPPFYVPGSLEGAEVFVKCDSHKDRTSEHIL